MVEHGRLYGEVRGGRNGRRFCALFLMVPALVCVVAAASAGAAEVAPTIDLRSDLGEEASPTLRVFGRENNSGLGSDIQGGVAYGDVNGDGYDDLIVGAPLADPAGGTSAGEAYVIYGNATRPTSSLSLHTAGTNGETRILGDNAGDVMGRAVACGDVNGDGYDDVILGADQSASNPDGAGRVYIVYGSPTLPDSTVNLNDAAGSHGETRIVDATTATLFGYSVATGDFDGDGFDDVAVGAAKTDVAGGVDGGAAYLVYGAADLPGVTVNPQAPGSTADVTRVLGDDVGGHAGWSVGCGDINGDGRSDLVVGAPAAQPPAGVSAGETYIVYGSGTLRNQDVDLNGTPGANGETRIVGDDSETVSGRLGDNTGYSVAAGDINGDGYDDAIIGTIGANVQSRIDTGRVYVIYGSSTLPGTIVNLDTNGAISSSNETRILGARQGDYLGNAVSAGDVNGDGIEDVILGASKARPTANAITAGLAMVVYGGSSLPGTSLDTLTQLPDVTVLGRNQTDLLGSSVLGGGDLDRDGFGEFAAAAFQGDNLLDAAPNDDDNSGYAAVAFGAGESAAAAAIERFGAGNTILRGFGGRLSPSVRAWIAFTGGNATPATATVRRDNDALSNLGGFGSAAEVYWQLTSTRAGWTSADLAFQYLDSEIAGLNEQALTLYRAASVSGPWTEVAGATLDVERNEISATVTSLGYFAIVANPGVFGVAIGAPSDALVQSGSVTFPVTYTQANAITLDAGDVTLLRTGTATATVGVGGSDANRTVTLSNISGDGTLRIALDADTARDVSDNAAAAAGPSAAVEVDNVPPIVTIRRPPFTGTRNTPIPFLVTYADADTVDLTASDVVLNKTNTANGTVVVTGTGNLMRTVTITNITGAGQLGITIKSGTASDALGQTAPGTTASELVNVDAEPPTVTVSAPSASATRNGPVTYTVTYSGASSITLAAANVVLNKTGTANGTVAVTGSGTVTRTVTISGITGNGTLGISLAAATAVDGQGNTALATGPSATFTVDNAGPTVTIGDPSVPVTTTGPVTYTVSYAGASAVTLAQGNITLVKTGSANATVGVSGSGNTRTVTLSGITGDGTLAISIAAGTATDALGNSAGAAGPSLPVSVANTTLGIAIGRPSPETTETGPVSFTITYLGASEVTLSLADITLNKTGTANGTVNVEGSGTDTRTVIISNITGNGTLGITIAAGTASNGAQNAPGAGPSATVQVGTSVPGDVNGDGDVNAVDVQMVVNAVLGIDVEGNPDQNGDGDVNAVDVQYVVNGVLGVL